MLATFTYPPARRGDTVDDFFGTPVADPYRWMEDPASPEVREFIDAQNKITHAYLNTPTREAAKAQLRALYSKPHVPSWRSNMRRGDYYFFSYNQGKDQAEFMRRKGVNGADEVALDPTTLSADGSAILMGTFPSPDGNLLAYGISRGGSDWQEFFVRDLSTGKDFDDHLFWCKFTFIIWKPDNSGFFYNRFPATEAGQEMLAGNFNASIYYHKVGTPQSDDVLIYTNPDAPEELFWPEGTDSGEYILLNIRPSSSGDNGYAYWKVDSDEPFVRLLGAFDTKYEFVGNQGRTFYFVTQHKPLKRVVAIDLDNPAPENWREIIPETTDALDSVKIAGGRLIAFYSHNAYTVAKVFTLTGEYLHDIELPAMGTVPTYFLDTDASVSDFLFTFTSFLFPMTIYRYDTASNSLEVFKASEMPVDASKFETRQVFYPSTDGARVSLFITHKRGLKLDGSNPALIYAYGGFDAGVSPEFGALDYVFMDNGGVYALANLRGGSEYGEAWHKGGMLENKQHVFDDMINAGEWLVANGYTSPAKLAIHGASNGGLLVATCVTQRPDLFGAGLCGVPVIDMLRYHLFTSGRLWTSEYGSAENADQFKFLYAYSPLHNIRQGETYPPTLIWSSDGDDRVVPMHSLKFAAALQAADSGKNPLLLRFGTQAGHGTVNINKVVEEEADLLAFLGANIGWSIQS